MMFNQEDLLLFKQKGMTEAQIKGQLALFASGFPFLKIKKPASIDAGIERIEGIDVDFFFNEWKKYLQGEHKILKFVPASGAASRMFKDLFEFAAGASELPDTRSVKTFFEAIKNFAFYDELEAACEKVAGKSVEALIKNNEYKTVVNILLGEPGMNYGRLPKGLLQFHKYVEGCRTPLEEHLVEGALYAKNQSGEVNVHFTVSPEHKALFKTKTEAKKSVYEQKFGVTYDISFSEQKSSTDTIAADGNNEPFREGGELIFRPGGHGALIENLNDLDADIIFIKNIDNVVLDTMNEATVRYKQLIAGVLVNLQEQIFDYLNKIEKGYLLEEEMSEILEFIEVNLSTENPSMSGLTEAQKLSFIIRKLNRPIRVCGMVKNEGEPGGGPFITENPDGTFSLQILESSQIDTSKPKEKALMEESTHFNPVDLVCGVKDYKGKKFNLLNFVDNNTGFISEKSKNGKKLKALELPGLWNGAMSDWNTIFVEVPIETFNPVKTVNDLLKLEHQSLRIK
jgi:hypothetical protein